MRQLYRDKLMFGLVADDIFYLKADAINRPGFESRGLGPFVYAKQGKDYVMSYYRIPDDALEDSRELCRWAQQACLAAQRSRSPRPASLIN